MQSIRFIKQSSTGGAVTHTLADGTKSMLVLEYDLQSQAVAQVVPKPRAVSPDVFYRDNLLWVARFVVRREFANVAAAHAFKHRHAKDVCGKGVFSSQIGGRFTSVVFGQNWVLQVKPIRDQGIGLYIEYEAMGPNPTTIGGF
jgi:hypothetical protein